MRRVWSVLAAAAVATLLHCSSGERQGFATDKPAGETTTSGGPGGSFGADGGLGDAPSGTCEQDIDVVLVLDVSSTMTFVLQKLESEMEKVVIAANALKEGARFGLVIFADNGALVTTGDLEGGKVHTASTTLTAAFANARSVYTAKNRNPGDGPSGRTTQNPICEENSLDALAMAATDFPWRPSAAHVAILVTDDTFLEKPDNYGDRDGDGLTDKTSPPTEGDYPARYDVDEAVAALKKSGVRVFSFTRAKQSSGGLLGGGCSTGRRYEGSDAPAMGWSKPFQGKPPIPEATGGKNFDVEEVRAGKLSLTATINEVVLESHCAGPPK